MLSKNQTDIQCQYNLLEFQSTICTQSFCNSISKLCTGWVPDREGVNNEFQWVNSHTTTTKLLNFSINFLGHAVDLVRILPRTLTYLETTWNTNT